MNIGIDHGYGYVKTSNTILVSGVKKYDFEPAVITDVVQYNNAYYVVGGNRQTVKENKMSDENYYILSLAAIAKEMKIKGLNRGNVILSVGLPLTLFGKEKIKFKEYLTKEKEVYFRYDNVGYKVVIENVEIYPQGYSAIVQELDTLVGTNLLVDIGSWTVDVLPIINKTPDQSRCASIDFGIISCISKMNEEFRRRFGQSVEETQIQEILQGKVVKIPEKYLQVAYEVVKEYTIDLIAKIRELGFNMDVIPTIYMGGGATVIKKYYNYNPDITTFIDNIHANAIGYEYITAQRQIKLSTGR